MHLWLFDYLERGALLRSLQEGLGQTALVDLPGNESRKE